jgi:hypothetical protein
LAVSKQDVRNGPLPIAGNGVLEIDVVRSRISDHFNGQQQIGHEGVRDSDDASICISCL